MKVSRQEAEENRARVVLKAGELFREYGFDGIGIADLMRAAGLTHGGFYGNFASKDDLAVEAVSTALAATTERLVETTASAPDRLGAITDYYLSDAHRDGLADGCVVAALAADAARGNEKLRAAFEAGIETYLDLLTPLMPATTEPARRREAMAAYATLVGALILSRTVTSPALSAELREAAGETVHKISA